MNAASVYSLDCVNVLLKNGADVTIKDSYGATVLDYMANYPPIFDLLVPYCSNHKFQSKAEMQQKVKIRLREHVVDLPDIFPPESESKKLNFRNTLWQLAEAFFYLGDYNKVRLCHEARVFCSPYIEREMDCTCLLCGKSEDSQSYWICKDCPLRNGVCQTCYELRSQGKIMPGCKDGHEYFEIGGSEWANLAPGLLNMEGRTIESFLRELKQQWLYS